MAWFCIDEAFKIMLRNEGGKHFLQTISNKLKRRVWKARKRQRKQQMAYEIHKNVGVLHAVVFADGALEAKSARVSSHRLFLKGAWSEQKANRTSNGATRASESEKKGSYQGRLGIKKVIFLIENA